MRGVFIAGTDTGVGKTLVSAALMAAAPSHVRYWKPIQTGLDLGDDDTRRVQELAGLAPARLLAEGARFKLPASPHHAAAVEGRPLSWRAVAALGLAQAPGATWVVEGVGGLCVPLDAHALLPGLVRALGLPVVIVGVTRLGAIHQALATLAAAREHGLGCLGLVLSGAYDASAWSGLEAHAGVPILGHLPPIETTPAAVKVAGARLLAVPALAEALA